MLIVPFFVWGGTVSLLAQVSSISPYSKLGLGEKAVPNFTRSMGFGDASLGLPQPLNLDASNPASYSQLKLVALEAGMETGRYRQEQANPSLEVENNLSRLRYLSAGVPLTDWWGSAIGLQPLSFMGYRITTSSPLPSDTSLNTIYDYQGEGNLSSFFWSHGFEVARNLSLGVRAEFIFGSLERNASVDFAERGFFDTRIEDETTVRGLRLQYGLQYQHPLKGQRYLGVGLSYRNATDLNATVSRFQYTTLIGQPLDTLSGGSEQAKEITTPGEFQIGLSFGQQHDELVNPAWAVNLDYAYHQDGAFRDVDGKAPWTDNQSLELGGFMVPRYTFGGLNRSKSYFSLVEYRIGGYLRETPYMVGGKQILDRGLTLGFGLPIRQRNMAPGEVKITSLNVGLRAGQRGSLGQGGIQERYLKLFLGITFNDKWFLEYKYR
jgi:hypothetical protein